MKEKFYVITFPTTHHALKFEQFIKEKGFNSRLIPVPREISSSCGLAARFEEDNLHEISQLVKANSIEYESLYFIDRTSNKKPEKTDF
ncbi:MAG: hypothetical protein PWQ82_536 [Thermosediminibacterales bacterium]|nr:hypothetical protein [Thermosediminibacterales bacterium]MDK2835950.1 hypothetical protein [Thermosediminibacterales bacterium]